MAAASYFISHGAPSLLLQQTPARYFLEGLGRQIEAAHRARPASILCVSAHWETRDPTVGAASHPSTIHDFYGFPPELYAMRYPAPGAPALADHIAALIRDAGLTCHQDPERGLDHGAWSPLFLMWPNADIPVLQLAIQPELGPKHHIALGRALSPLLAENVLILASGGAVHNLSELSRVAANPPVAGWAQEFEDWLAAALFEGDVDRLAQYRRLAPHAARAHPRDEHLLPLFVAFGAAGATCGTERLHQSYDYGTLSLAAFAFHPASPIS